MFSLGGLHVYIYASLKHTCMYIGFLLEISNFLRMTELKEFFNEFSMISKTQVYRILNFDFSF